MRDAHNISPEWTLSPLRTLLRRRKERATGKETLLSVTQSRGVILQEEVGRRDSSNDDKSSYWRVEPGDIVYNTMRMWQGVSGRSTTRGIVSPAYTVCEPIEDIDTRFLAYLFKSPYSISKFYRLSQGLVSDTWNLRYPAFASIKFAIPPLAEQRRIAEILDSFDLAISHLHSSATKFSQLRTAHIRKLMDDGLSILRSVEASELSRVERKMHDRWTVAPLASTLNAIEAGNSPKVEDTPAGPGEWGVLKVSAIGRHGFRPEENKVAHDKSLHVKNLCIRPGDLLISRANTSELVGMTCVVRETPPGLMLCDKTLRLHVNPARTSAEYVHLALSLTEIRRQIETAATGTSGSMKNISQAAIRRLVIPWTDRELMDQVVRDDAAYATQIEALMRQEKRLNRLKSGLMEDLLTGRVRVSEAEAVLESL